MPTPSSVMERHSSHDNKDRRTPFIPKQSIADQMRDLSGPGTGTIARGMLEGLDNTDSQIKPGSIIHDCGTGSGSVIGSIFRGLEWTLPPEESPYPAGTKLAASYHEEMCCIKIYATDIDPNVFEKMDDWAKEKPDCEHEHRYSNGWYHAIEGPNAIIERSVMSAAKLDFADDMFTYHFCNFVLWGLPDIKSCRDTLEEAERVLKPGGVAVFSVSDPLPSHEALARVRKERWGMERGTKFWDEDFIEQHFWDAGFAKVELVKCDTRSAMPYEGGLRKWCEILWSHHNRNLFREEDEETWDGDIDAFVEECMADKRIEVGENGAVSEVDQVNIVFAWKKGRKTT